MGLESLNFFLCRAACSLCLQPVRILLQPVFDQRRDVFEIDAGDTAQFERGSLN